MRQSNVARAVVRASALLLAFCPDLLGQARVAAAEPPSAPSAAPPPAPASSATAPAAAAIGPGSPFRTCSAGFSPGREPRLDALRLAVACGPVTGLDRLARLSSVVDESGPPAVLRFPVQKGDCLRIFAVAAAPVDDLEVEIIGPHSRKVSLTNQSRRWVMVGEGGPFCPSEPGDYEARFTTHAGRGALAALVRRGARMRVKGSPFVDGAPSAAGDPY